MLLLQHGKPWNSAFLSPGMSWKQCCNICGNPVTISWTIAGKGRFLFLNLNK